MFEQFELYAPIIKSLSSQDLEREIEHPKLLSLGTAIVAGKEVSVNYAPFDFINLRARIVIVGLTPGRQQMSNALREAHRLLHSGATIEIAAEKAKVFASFSGAMRKNLIGMLDHVGIPEIVGLSTTSTLWGRDADQVHFTSALRYPVFVDGTNYSGSPDLMKTPLLAAHLRKWFAEEMLLLRDALFIPLGPKVSAILLALARELHLNPNRILAGLPHPSGASAERIKYFVGRKPRTELSNKTNPALLDAAKEKLLLQIQGIKDI